MASEYEQSERKQRTKEISLPKNYRQIGEPGRKKIYMEDYVHTYLSKLSRPENYYARGAILFGRTMQTEKGNYLFISGAAACQQFELDLQETVFDEKVWDDIYKLRDEYFPGMEVVGWFLSRMGFSTDLNDRIIRLHLDNFSGENKVLYIVDSLENEDAFYQLENYTLKKQKGYYIYYETNEPMKNYMMAEREKGKNPVNSRKEDQKTAIRDAAVVRNYKRTLDKKKKVVQKRKPWWSPTNMVASVAMVAVLLYAVYSVQLFYRNQETATVYAPSDQEEATIETYHFSENPSEEEQTEERSEKTGSETGAKIGEEGTENNPENKEVSQNPTSQNSNMQQDTEMIDVTKKNNQEDDNGNDEENVDVFTQEEPDDVQAAWSYIGGYYTVQKGDTLAGISKKIYQSYDYINAIANANGIENINQIFPGQVLEIPEIED